MDKAKANKLAAKQSKTQGPQFVVWVFDEGRDVYNAEQARRYAPLIQIEGAYVGGVEVAAEMAQSAAAQEGGAA